MGCADQRLHAISYDHIRVFCTVILPQSCDTQSMTFRDFSQTRTVIKRVANDQHDACEVYRMTLN